METIVVIVYFLSICYKLRSSEKRDPQLRRCLPKTGLCQATEKNLEKKKKKSSLGKTYTQEIYYILDRLYLEYVYNNSE